MFTKNRLIARENLHFATNKRIFVTLARNAGAFDRILNYEHEASDTNAVSGSG